MYVIHGDDFHDGFIKAHPPIDKSRGAFLEWPDILRFNWECVLSVAQKALERDLDVIIDYVVEEELPLLKRLAADCQAHLFYVVLTATQEELIQRLTQRGSSDLIDRSLFLKDKLDHAPENLAHLFNTSNKSVEQEIAALDMAKYKVRDI